MKTLRQHLDERGIDTELALHAFRDFLLDELENLPKYPNKKLGDLVEAGLLNKLLAKVNDVINESCQSEALICDKTKEPPCHLEPSEKLCGKCSLNESQKKVEI